MRVFLIILTAAALMFTSCNEEEKVETHACRTLVTIKDLTGLDGCGFVFELSDGTMLEPYRIGYCGVGETDLPKEITEDPLYNFEFVDGKKVLVGYESTKMMSSCMAGTVVKITCISEAVFED